MAITPITLSRIEWLQSRSGSLANPTDLPQDRFTQGQAQPVQSETVQSLSSAPKPQVLNNPTYVPMEAGQVGLPFAQPMEQGQVELNQVPHLIAGLRATGDQPAVTAVLGG